MKARGIFKWVALFVLTGTLGALGHHFGGRAHIRRKLGQVPLANATCFNCHFVSTQNLPWARPRPHHDSPAGLAVTPDGKRILVALDDRDEIAEVDTSSYRVLRRVRVPGTPYGLAMDPAGQSLFVACKGDDQLRVLDGTTLEQIGSVPVGMGPVAVAFSRAATGDRLVVANSMSDDISVISVSPLKELSRVEAGREPFAVAALPDGTRVFVANRLVGLASVKSIPESELSVVDPSINRVVKRERLVSAHLSEGICLVPGRSWALTPLVKVRNLVPITQVANGWVMSSGLALSDFRSGEIIQLPLDEANDFFSDPSAIVSDLDGHRVFVASGGSDVVTVIDLDRVADWLRQATTSQKQDAINDLTLSSEYVTARIHTGRNPRQLAVSPRSDWTTASSWWIPRA
jgi:YVTN family beta-propeller protein